MKGLSPNHVCSSQDGHILCRVDFGWTNKRVFSKNHGFVQKSRWPYSMQNKYGIDKIQGSYKLSGYMYYSLSEYISHHLKRYRTTCRLKALDAYLNKKYIMDENKPLSE